MPNPGGPWPAVTLLALLLLVLVFAAVDKLRARLTARRIERRR